MLKTVAISAVVTVAILLVVGHVAPVRKVFGI
jgi:hypothetical protein